MLGYLKQVVAEFGKDKAGQLSAAFAYTAVFSIGPLLLVVVSIVGFIYGKKAAAGQLFGQLSQTLGPDTAKTLQNVVANSSHAGKGAAALAFGLIGLLLAAVALTNQLQNSFDAILQAVPDPRAGFKFSVYTKVKNILVIAAASIIALVSLSLSAALNGFGKGIALEAINNAASYLIFIVIVYLIYRVLPNVMIPRLLVLKTSLVISLMFLAGKIVLGIIIGRNGTASAYGAAAAVITLLLWFYYTAQILLLGAEGIKVYGLRHKIEFSSKRFTLKRERIEVNAKKDFRGKLVQAFSRGYKSKSKPL